MKRISPELESTIRTDHDNVVFMAHALCHAVDALNNELDALREEVDSAVEEYNSALATLNAHLSDAADEVYDHCERRVSRGFGAVEGRAYDDWHAELEEEYCEQHESDYYVSDIDVPEFHHPESVDDLRFTLEED